jgi:hypothetical protein
MSLAITYPNPKTRATQTWTWSAPPVRQQELSALPGNKADDQFVKQDSAISAFSCEYTGRHDAGPLPPQRMHAEHALTLYFLEKAREACALELVDIMREEKAAGDARRGGA